MLCGMWWEWQCCVGRGGRGTAVVGVAVLCGTWWAWHCCGGSGNAVWEVVGVTLINHIKKNIFTKSRDHTRFGGFC